MNSWIDIANRGAHFAEVLVWNHVIHSWIDPLGIAVVMLTLAYGLMRGIKWVITL